MFAYREHYAPMARGMPDPTSVESIAFRLKVTRKALGHTQAVMSRLIGSSTEGQVWGNYEAGERRISLDHALAACARFGLTLDWIYRGQIYTLPGDVADKIQRQIIVAEEEERVRARR